MRFMKSSLCTILFYCMFSFTGIAQPNFVYNGSFERYTSCPDNLSLIARCIGWRSATAGSPDFYHTCGSGVVGVPINVQGYQMPLEGKGYSGIYAYTGGAATANEYREYITSTIPDMIVGMAYDVSFSVSLADSSKFACDGLGVLFYKDGFNGNGVSVIGTKPQVSFDNLGIVTEKNGWIRLRTKFTADSAYGNIVIGGFNKDSDIHLQVVTGNDSNAYYYIDSVVVKKYCDTIPGRHSITVCKEQPFEFTLVHPREQDVYTWNTGANTQSILIQHAGNFTCTSIKDCDYYVDTFYVKEFDGYAQTQRDTLVCKEDVQQLVLRLPSGATSYTWNTGARAQETNINDIGVFWGGYIKDCIYHTDTFHVKYRTFDGNITLGRDRFLCIDESSITIGADLGNGLKYIWNTGDTTRFISPKYTGHYTLSATDGCRTTTDTVYLDLRDCKACVFNPTAFTPNNDGRNDVFKALAHCNLTSFELKVFNRFGQQVFSTNNIATGWDGLHDGIQAELGTYFYYLRYKVEGENKLYLKKGDVVLIR
jgi:gliding motility-associated-like protein